MLRFFLIYNRINCGLIGMTPFSEISNLIWRNYISPLYAQRSYKFVDPIFFSDCPSLAINDAKKSWLIATPFCIVCLKTFFDKQFINTIHVHKMEQEGLKGIQIQNHILNWNYWRHITSAALKDCVSLSI